MKINRDLIRNKFGGKCAYCGNELSNIWHADHLIPIMRGYGENGGYGNTYADSVFNLMPACPPCNIDKATFSIEEWRKLLSTKLDALRKYTSNYRVALRFGLVTEQPKTITFYF